MKLIQKLLVGLLTLMLLGAVAFFGVFRMVDPYAYHNVWYRISNITLYRLNPFRHHQAPSGEEVPQASEEIAAWLAEEGIDTSVDPAYPDVTMTNLQGTWRWKNLGGFTEELTFSGNQCTVNIPELGMENETYDCAIMNRSAAGLCPKLVVFEYPGETAGLTYYISQVEDNTFTCDAQEMTFYRVS